MNAECLLFATFVCQDSKMEEGTATKRRRLDSGSDGSGEEEEEEEDEVSVMV